jgi:hypothetical protein
MIFKKIKQNFNNLNKYQIKSVLWSNIKKKIISPFLAF